MIDFPASPTDGQIFNAPNGVVYQYSTTYSSWLALTSGGVGGTGDFCASGSGALPATLTTAQPATSVSGNSGLWYTSANGQYRPPAGRYYLYGTMVATNPSAASSIQMVIRRNGTVIANSLDTISAAGYSAYVSPFTVIDANGSDIFDWQINGFLAATTSNYFSIGAFPLTGMGAGAGPYLPLAGGTLTGPLTGTTATLISPDNLATTNIISALANNGTQGPSLWYGGIRAGGSLTNVDINIDSKGTGNIGIGFNSTGTVLINRPLSGTTATFNGGGFNGALKVTTNDSIIGGLFAGATKGVRIVPNAAYTAIEGVDNTGVGSYQPLTISGSVVNIAAPLSGTTATLSTAIAAGSNDTTVPTTAWVRANVGGGGSGKLLQTVYNRTGTGGTGTTIIPFDTTIPQITEGDEYMTLAVTPTSATSLLIIDVVWIGSNSAVNNMGVALFKDATASALTAAAATVTAANATVNIKFKYIMVSGSTAAATFRVRAGGGAAGTTSFNSGTTFGFVMCSSMTIQEVTP